MSRKLEEPTIRKHVVLFRRDYERIIELFHDNIGASRAIRKIVREFIKGVDAAVERGATRPTIEIDLEEGAEVESE